MGFNSGLKGLHQGSTAEAARRRPYYPWNVVKTRIVYFDKFMSVSTNIIICILHQIRVNTSKRVIRAEHAARREKTREAHDTRIHNA
jgi:S-adenosylmethionine hydrolase